MPQRPVSILKLACDSHNSMATGPQLVPFSKRSSLLPGNIHSEIIFDITQHSQSTTSLYSLYFLYQLQSCKTFQYIGLIHSDQYLEWPCKGDPFTMTLIHSSFDVMKCYFFFILFFLLSKYHFRVSPGLPATNMCVGNCVYQ